VRGREALTWYYLRVSGALMVVLVLGHLFVMHYQHAPSTTGAAFVNRRWAGASWRLFDWMLLVLALTHGLVGAHGVLRDHVRRGRAAFDGVFAVGGLAFVTLGTISIAAGTRGESGGPLAGADWIPTALIAGLVVLASLTYLAILGAAGVLVAFLLRRRPLGWWTYPGQWAFALSRAAGVGILGFLLLHIVDIALVPFAPGLYERTVTGYALPYLVPMEVLLVAAVVYHALNGLRLMVLDALDRRATAARGPSFVVVIVVTALLVLPSVVLLLRAHL
jgi:succinate dehydrogenase / fumarate reductase, membrane anchor subunit